MMNGFGLINVFILFPPKSDGRRNKQDLGMPPDPVGEDILDAAVFFFFFLCVSGSHRVLTDY